MLATRGLTFSFENSFNASAKGWGIPKILTLFGPFRIWEYPMIFRSRRVKKAIAAKAIKKVIIIDEMDENIKT